VSYDCRKLDRWAESGNLGRLNLSTWIKFVVKFHRDLPRKFCIQKMPLMNSVLLWLLIWPISTHGLVIANFWSQVTVLIRFWTDLTYMCLIRFLSHKKDKTCWGLNTSSEGNMLSLPMPNWTHIFDNRNNGYGHLNTVNVRSLAGRWKLVRRTVWRLATGSDSEDCDF
jgi:hypothetical protein